MKSSHTNGLGAGKALALGSSPKVSTCLGYQRWLLYSVVAAIDEMEIKSFYARQMRLPLEIHCMASE